MSLFLLEPAANIMLVCFVWPLDWWHSIVHPYCCYFISCLIFIGDISWLSSCIQIHFSMPTLLLLLLTFCVFCFLCPKPSTPFFATITSLATITLAHRPFQFWGNVAHNLPPPHNHQVSASEIVCFWAHMPIVLSGFHPIHCHCNPPLISIVALTHSPTVSVADLCPSCKSLILAASAFSLS